MYAYWWKVILLFCVFGSCIGSPCTLCSYINQTTNLSDCTESCGGGTRHYFQYVCCGNLTRSQCGSRCNITLTITKSVKVLFGCNTFCNNGGTFHNDTVGTGMCLCPLGTTGRCCDIYVNDTTVNSTPSFFGTSNPTESGTKVTNATKPVTTYRTKTQSVNNTRVQVKINTQSTGSSRVSTVNLQNIRTKNPSSESGMLKSTDDRKQGIEVTVASTTTTNTSRLSTATSSEGTQSISNKTEFLTENPIQNGKSINSSTGTSTKSVVLNTGSNPTSIIPLNIQNDTDHLGNKTGMGYTDSSKTSSKDEIVGSMTTKALKSQNNHTEIGLPTSQTSTKQETTEGEFFTKQSEIISQGITSTWSKGIQTPSKVDHFQEKQSQNAKGTLYIAVGVSSGVILIAVVIALLFYAGFIKKPRNNRVGQTNDQIN